MLSSACWRCLRCREEKLEISFQWGLEEIGKGGALDSEAPKRSLHLRYDPFEVLIHAFPPSSFPFTFVGFDFWSTPDSCPFSNACCLEAIAATAKARCLNFSLVTRWGDVWPWAWVGSDMDDILGELLSKLCVGNTGQGTPQLPLTSVCVEISRTLKKRPAGASLGCLVAGAVPVRVPVKMHCVFSWGYTSWRGVISVCPISLSSRLPVCG